MALAIQWQGDTPGSWDQLKPSRTRREERLLLSAITQSVFRQEKSEPPPKRESSDLRHESLDWIEKIQLSLVAVEGFGDARRAEMTSQQTRPEPKLGWPPTKARRSQRAPTPGRRKGLAAAAVSTQSCSTILSRTLSWAGISSKVATKSGQRSWSRQQRSGQSAVPVPRRGQQPAVSHSRRMPLRILGCFAWRDIFLRHTQFSTRQLPETRGSARLAWQWSDSTGPADQWGAGSPSSSRLFYWSLPGCSFRSAKLLWSTMGRVQSDFSNSPCKQRRSHRWRRQNACGRHRRMIKALRVWKKIQHRAKFALATFAGAAGTPGALPPELE